ncbi:MAG: DUF4982 domain-containing protein, partial [Planctomycetota bacterium]|nr:DUF4982 domain-containing protein [Planctomycetota bacterium]
QPLGVRTFRFDAEKGFFLNGRPYPLRGVNRHQDFQDKGWAIGPAEMETDIGIMLEMGCNAVRLVHYPHADEFHRLCDERGLVVWSEFLMHSGTSLPKWDETRQNAAEFVKQNYNHPSIACWSLWNELKARETRFEERAEFCRRLGLAFKQLDPDRPTTCATDRLEDGQKELNEIPDVLGCNKYPGWYYGAPEDWAAVLAEMRQKFPKTPWCISEYGAGASILQHDVAPARPAGKGGPNASMFHSEEWQAAAHERIWKQLRQAPWLWGTFIWVGFDLSSVGRNEGDRPGINDKGLVTYDRKVRKDAWYVDRANWNPEPMVYIAGRRFTPRPSGPAAVKVYSNCPEVELFVVGKSQGVRREGEDCVFVWDSVALPEGDVRVEAVARRDGRTLRDECVWKCSPAAPGNLDLSGRSKQ